MTADNVERLRQDPVMAEELRRDIAEPLKQVCEVMNRAKAAGLVLNFNIAADQYGRFRAPEINIVKPL